MSVQELERFKAFVKRKPAFDVVVDGLNVANINKDKSKLSETVRKTQMHMDNVILKKKKKKNERVQLNILQGLPV